MGAIIAGLVGLALIPIVVTWLFQAMGGEIITSLPERMGVLMPVTLGLIALYILFTLTAAFFA